MVLLYIPLQASETASLLTWSCEPREIIIIINNNIIIIIITAFLKGHITSPDCSSKAHKLRYSESSPTNNKSSKTVK